MHPDWIEHRRGLDGELLGWMHPVGEGFVALDLLGRPRTEVVDWAAAEGMLDEVGIAYLAEPYELQIEPGHWLRVRVTEVSASHITFKKEDWGDMNAPQLFYTRTFPLAPDQLRPLEG
jgi:hypothetical protein